MLKIQSFEMNPFGVNTYLVYDTESRDAVLVDPAMLSEREHTAVEQFVTDHHLKMTDMVNTHLHIDHCIGNRWAADRYGLPVAAGTDDAPLGAQMQAQAQMFHMPVAAVPPLSVEKPLNDGDVVKVGGYELHVLAVPGHSPGSMAFYAPGAGFVITGDTLFDGSIGRTDLPGGNHSQLIEAIRTKLFTLPDDTVVYPGHGPSTTIGYEKAHNPYLR